LEVNKSHIVDRILELTKPFELSYNKTDLNIFYKTSEKSKKNIEDFLIKNDLMYKFNAIINVSNNPKIGFWGVDNYNNLIKYLHNYDISVIVVSSIEDIEIAEKISDKNNILFYNTELDIYAELIKNSDFIFTPDSFTIQLGAAFKIPTFCLFVQHKESEMINVPYNSDFDFALTEKNNLKNISYGKVLNSFVPYFEYVYERYQRNIIN
jgi:ADP-heptose:LPS heptosyltransferase